MFLWYVGMSSPTQCPVYEDAMAAPGAKGYTGKIVSIDANHIEVEALCHSQHKGKEGSQKVGEEGASTKRLCPPSVES